MKMTWADWTLIALLVFCLFYLSGCATVESKFRTYHSMCEADCKGESGVRKVTVSVLEMDFQCECKEGP